MVQQILMFETPKVKGRTNLTTKGRIYAYYPIETPQPFLSWREMFEQHLECFSISFVRPPGSPALLTSSEIEDIEAGLREIQSGQAYRFNTVDEFLKHLNAR